MSTSSTIHFLSTCLSGENYHENQFIRIWKPRNPAANNLVNHEQWWNIFEHSSPKPKESWTLISKGQRRYKIHITIDEDSTMGPSSTFIFFLYHQGLNEAQSNWQEQHSFLSLLILMLIFQKYLHTYTYKIFYKLSVCPLIHCSWHKKIMYYRNYWTNYNKYATESSFRGMEKWTHSFSKSGPPIFFEGCPWRVLTLWNIYLHLCALNKASAIYRKRSIREARTMHRNVFRWFRGMYVKRVWGWAMITSIQMLSHILSKLFFV